MKMPEALAADTRVNHPRHGVGQVIVDADEFVVARFGAVIQQVLRTELTLARSLDQALATRTFDESDETLMRASAMAIRSVNDQWGVFSRSRVQLLPHQLWVCHKVNRTFPFRWLVADDVGLGKNHRSRSGAHAFGGSGPNPSPAGAGACQTGAPMAETAASDVRYPPAGL